jgi:hypothetical protein
VQELKHRGATLIIIISITLIAVLAFLSPDGNMSKENTRTTVTPYTTPGEWAYSYDPRDSIPKDTCDGNEWDIYYDKKFIGKCLDVVVNNINEDSTSLYKKNPIFKTRKYK